MREGCSGRCRTLLYISGLWREGMREFEAGDHARGESLQRKALAILVELGGFPVIEAKIHNNLGVILCCSGRSAEARWEFSQALTLLSSRVTPGSRFHEVLARNYTQSLAPRELPDIRAEEREPLAQAS
ncbi:MAG: hypothetical protein HY916_07755 [Desulfovibrio sp.]|jgi:hypothetical protein|nr:hypothetical protein [Desulfovibrio sp.]